MSVEAKINLTQLIDERPIGVFQIRTILLCAFVAFLDGYNTQSIGVAGPFIARSLSFQASSLASVFSSALLGAMIGAMTFGPLADRYGRKRTLVAAVLLFSAFTLATAFSEDLRSLLAYRFIAGLGLGGATPCFIALTTEYAPARNRAALVAGMWAAFPLGGVIGGLINPPLMSAWGWRSLFYGGSAATALLVILLGSVLPESLRYLVAIGAPEERLRRICGHLFPGFALTGRLSTEIEPARGGGFAMLRTVPMRTTLLLWVVFLSSFMILVFIPLWAPSLLVRSGGLSPASAAFVVATTNMGSAVGTVGFSRVLYLTGIKVALVTMLVCGALVTAGIGFSGASAPTAAGCAFLDGILLGAASAAAIALAASIYPTVARSTGIGWAMALGRLGQVLGPLVAGALLTQHLGAEFIFPTIGSFALVAAVCAYFIEYQPRKVAAL